MTTELNTVNSSNLIFQKLCHKEWLPSRLETECVRGDGIVFTFPEKACSPFYEHRKSKSTNVAKRSY